LTDPSANKPDSPASAGSKGDERGFGLVAIDIDGTLLRSDNRLSTETLSAVIAARRSGVHVVLTSARPPRGVRHIYEALGLTTVQINYNGALIIDPHAEKKVLFHQAIDLQVARDLVEYVKQQAPKVVINLEILDRWYTESSDPQKLPAEAAHNFKPDEIGPLEQFLIEPVTKLMLVGEKQEIEPLRRGMLERFPRQIAVARSRPYLVQVIHPDVDKGGAVQRVAGHYGVPQKKVLAIGDESNDVGMLKWAGLGVAVDNAVLPARFAADVVVPSNDQDGVAAAIRRYVVDGDPPPAVSGRSK